MKRSLLTLSLLTLSTPLLAQAGFRLESSASSVRSGDSVMLDVLVDNPNGLQIAGYQIQFGWDAETLEMVGPPAVTSSSVLLDIFGTNSPPFGNGFSNCPDAGNGLSREASFSLGVALPSNIFSGSVGHLFRVPYDAKQASQQAPVPLLITEFESCTGNSTLLSDPTGTAISLSYIDTSVEITPNLSVTGAFQPGGQVDFEIHERPGEVWRLAVSLEYLETNIGSMGTLYFNHSSPSFRVLGMGTMGAGPEIATVTIPGLPVLIGQTVYAQTLTGTGLAQRLSNMVSFVIT